MASTNNQGLNVRGQGDSIISCKVIDNRNGVYINDAKNITVEGCVITGNRTGMQICNNVDGLKILNNTITGNYTLGVLFNLPVIADNGVIKVNNNTISGNWYGNIRSRFALTTTRIDATKNYFGTELPIKSSKDWDEPGYTAQVPAKFGGTAPATPADVNGDTYSVVDVSPWYKDASMTTLVQLDTDIWVSKDFAAAADNYVALPSGKVAVMGTNAFASINAAITAAAAGNTIHVLDGTYDEQVALNKSVTLKGEGTGKTLLKRTDNTGSGIAIGADDVTVQDLSITGYSYGFNLGNVSNVTLKNVYANGNTTGVKIPSTTAVDGLAIDNCRFNDNTQHGLYADTNKTALPDVKNVTITDTQFTGNGGKAFYIEKLSKALFKNVTFAGETDLNLKYKTYSDITFEDCSVTATGIVSGTLNTSGNGLLIKGRNDGSSYSAQPATVDGVTIKGGTYTSPAGFKAISLGNNIGNISFVKDGSDKVFVTGAGTGLDLYTDAAVTLNNIAFAGTLDRFISLGSASNVDATASGMSFGSLTDEAAIENKMYHQPDNAALGFITWDTAAQASADLSMIQTSAGAISPVFNKNTKYYSVNLGVSSDKTTLTVTTASKLATVTVDGVSGSTKEVILDKAMSQTVEFTVTAQKGATKTYVVTVNRMADGRTDLKSLAASKGNAEPVV